MPNVTCLNTCGAHEKNNNSISLIYPVKHDRQDAPVEKSAIDKAMHDFRSSLSVIMGYSELMLDGAMGDMTAEQRDGLKDILTNSQQMLDLINDISKWQNTGKD